MSITSTAGKSGHAHSCLTESAVSRVVDAVLYLTRDCFGRPKTDPKPLVHPRGAHAVTPRIPYTLQ